MYKRLMGCIRNPKLNPKLLLWSGVPKASLKALVEGMQGFSDGMNQGVLITVE